MPLTTLDPAPALVVIDLQKGIVSVTVAHVVPHAAALAKAFREHDLPVMLVNVTGRAPGRTDVGGHGSAGTLPAGWADIVDELELQPGDHLITKRRRSAFHDTVSTPCCATSASPRSCWPASPPAPASSPPHAPPTTTATTSCSPRTRWLTTTPTPTGTASSASSPSSARPRPAPRSLSSSTAGRTALTVPPAGLARLTGSQIHS